MKQAAVAMIKEEITALEAQIARLEQENAHSPVLLQMLQLLSDMDGGTHPSILRARVTGGGVPPPVSDRSV